MFQHSSKERRVHYLAQPFYPEFLKFVSNLKSTKEMITKKPADFIIAVTGNRIECELRGVGTCSVVKTVYKVRRSS